MIRKILLLSAVLLVAGGVLAAALYSWRSGPAVLQLPGIVEIQEVRLGSKVGGRVAEVPVLEGEEVKEGQVLVRFDTPELAAQRQQLEARLQLAEADLLRARNGPRPQELEAARAAADAARARWQKLKAGWREEEIRYAKSELEAADADVKLAREEFDRIDRLIARGSGSRAEHDAARANRDRALGRVAAARARYEMYAAGSRPEDIAEAAADLARLQDNYELLQAGTRPEEIAAAAARVAEIKGLLHENQVNQDEASVRAPGPAIIEVLAVRKGDLIAPNQPVVRILRAEDIWVKVFVPATQLGRVDLNREVAVKVDGYPNRPFRGKVLQVATISEFTPRNVQSVDERQHQVFAVKVRIEDPQGIFKSGMAAEVTLPLRDESQ
jgi:multidrug resistance efflux pump